MAGVLSVGESMKGGVLIERGGITERERIMVPEIDAGICGKRLFWRSLGYFLAQKAGVL